jgi:hypothetical protein
MIYDLEYEMVFYTILILLLPNLGKVGYQWLFGQRNNAEARTEACIEHYWIL